MQSLFDASCWPSPAPEILVTLAVHNGETTLRRVLECYTRLVEPSSSWALAIVDNASTDGTAQIIRDFAGRLPIVALFEAGPGKNTALNHALEVLQPRPATYIFTDDDAEPETDFLVAWQHVLDENPDRMLLGGKIRTSFLETPPRWLSGYSAHFLELYSAMEDGNTLGYPFRPLGPNMAVRGVAFDDGSRFFEGIGPAFNNRRYPMGSETDFCDRLIAKTGVAALFDPRPCVTHLVRPWQMTRQFVDGRAFRSGAGLELRRQRSWPHLPAPSRNVRARALQSLRWLLALAGVARFRWSYHWTRGAWSARDREGNVPA